MAERGALLVLLAGALLAAGCARPGAPLPALAERQRPLPVAAGAWSAAGRCLLEGPGRRLEGRAEVVRGADGLRVALHAAEGPPAIELAVAADGVVSVLRCADGLHPAADWLGLLAWQVWGAPAGQPAPDGDRWLAEDGRARRWYGGDPLLLRAVSLPQVRAEVGDYRLGEARPLVVCAEGALFTLALALDGFAPVEAR